MLEQSPSHKKTLEKMFGPTKESSDLKRQRQFLHLTHQIKNWEILLSDAEFDDFQKEKIKNKITELEKEFEELQEKDKKAA